MSKPPRQYKCYLCGKHIGTTLEERIQHLKKHHKALLKEKDMDIEKAVLLYTKQSDYKDAPVDVNKKKVKADVRSRMKGVCLRKKYVNIGYYLKGLRGREVTDLHTCSCCGKVSYQNWEYQCPGNVIRYLCPKCHTQVKFYAGKTEIIYNPVGTNRRRH